jgi:hypothetical protein
MSNHPLVYAMVPVYHHPYISSKTPNYVDLLDIAQAQTVSPAMATRIAKARSLGMSLIQNVQHLQGIGLSSATINAYEAQLRHIKDILTTALEHGTGVY